MGDLIAFEDYPNTTVPFDTKEHKVFYRDLSHQYEDFHFGNTYNSTCTYPRFWLESGALVGSDITDQLSGCYDSEFDQVGKKMSIKLSILTSYSLVTSKVLETLMVGSDPCPRQLASKIDSENGSHPFARRLNYSPVSLS